ncbi:MAG: ABC transporter ATP-binding protein [Calditrichia bacterium]
MSAETVNLIVDHVFKTYKGATDLEVLKNISFKMSGGDSVAITGPSGSGKSTLLHLIGTLDNPTSGQIMVNDQNPFELKAGKLAHFRNSMIGFVFQDHHLMPQYNVLENVMVPALAFRGDRNAQKDRAKKLLDRVGLTQRLNHLPAELSGGERQRVAIARALINSPALILCDEPTGNLDHDNAMMVANLLFELHKEMQSIMITVTHSEELAGLFPRRFQLQQGEIQKTS